MIDTHCHLEQSDYDADRVEVIEKCRQNGMKAIITCAAEPADYESTFQLVQQNPNFVFAMAAIHPQYVKRFSDEDVEAAMATIEANKQNVVAIGEIGLDYGWIADEEWREKQRQMFAKFIQFAKRIDLPIVVHLRNGEDKDEHSVFDDAFEILEREKAERVQLHMFGSRRLVDRAIANGWFISMNAICLRSKSYSKVVRDTPINQLLLETDAPWLHPSFDKAERNDPTHIHEVVERIAEIKKMTIDDVVRQTTENAVEFFRLQM